MGIYGYRGIIEKGYFKESAEGIIWSLSKKRNQHENVEIDLLTPVSGFKFAFGKLVHPEGFYVPVESEDLYKIIYTSTLKNGVIQEPCVVIANENSFSVIRADSTEYIELYRKYEELNQAKIDKASSKDFQVFDVVSFMKGRNRKENMIYLGEYYTLPVKFYSFYSIRSNEAYQLYPNDKIVKKYLFGKYDEKTKNFKALYSYSSFPLILEKTGQNKIFQSETALLETLNLTLKRMLLGHRRNVKNQVSMFDNFEEKEHPYIGDKFIGTGDITLVKLYNFPISNMKEDILSMFNDKVKIS